MALEYDGQRIGAMQYNGVTIGEAMIDGQIVYRSVIRVTPVAPTFHDGEPWITLPTVEGVTYSVSGTPGAGNTVTVTAEAEDGYELDGTSSWTHIFPSVYPVNGTWPSTAFSSGRTVTATHTVQETGMFTITHTATSEGTFAVAALIDGPWGRTTGPSSSPSTATTTRSLVAGDVVTFSVTHAYYRVTASGSWSIVKN